MEIAILLHVTSIFLITVLCVLGGAIGGGISSVASMQALNIQPRAKSEIVRASLIGLALIETSTILALIITIILFLKTPEHLVHSLSNSIAELGITFAIGITSFVVGIISALPVKSTCYAIARQPFFSQNILNLMFITQSVIQSSVLFGFLVALLIKAQVTSLETTAQAFQLLAAGLAIGIGSIGPAIGLSIFAEQACKGISVNRSSYAKILPFTLMSEGIIETPLIFAFAVSLVLLIPINEPTTLTSIRAVAAALCIGIGTLGPSLSSSKLASKACEKISSNPEHYSILSQTSMFGQGIIDAAAVYALLTAIHIIFLR
ncbi:MAG: ATP synthase F0 subunit C [Candidatus Babeliales bacterium]